MHFYRDKAIFIIIKIKKAPKWLKSSLSIIIILFVLFFLYDLIFPFHPEIKYSQVILSSDEKILSAYLNEDDKWRIKTELHEVSPDLKKAIIYKEDKYFHYHPGVNPVALFRALIKNLLRREITSGASTITMQVARMLDPANRTYFNKCKEIIRAFQLELHYAKEDIFLMYLNLIPYGGNIEGIKTAALLYLDQNPKALSLSQITVLSIIPNDPKHLDPTKNTALLLKMRDYWLEYFRRKKLFNDETIDDALSEDCNFQRTVFPRIAPHLSFFLKNKYSNDIYIHSHINSGKQIKTEQLVFNYIQPLKRMGITNASVLVLNNKTKKIEVYVGSADYNDKNHQGQVDGIRAVRSPGSALKPLLYAMAFDRGIATPKRIISDIPVNYGGYMPENYNGCYMGPVTVEKALAQSLNIPAVQILDQVGVENFVNKLSDGGFQTIKKKSKELGYSIILGGCGITLMELTQTFSAFANNGFIYNYCLCKNDKVCFLDTFCSKAAVFMITEILSSPKRADMPVNFENSVYLPRIAWKTGTSYGRRDAWAVGYNPEYTIGVWMGNFPGTGVPELNGTDFAVPLLFSVFNALQINASENWFSIPPDVDFRLVCSETGLVPSEFCTNLIMDAYIPGVSNNSSCKHMMEVAVDKNETYSFCKSCLPEAGYKKILYRNYAPELIAFFEDEHIPYQKIPPHNPNCKRIHDENAPKIISLVNDMEYVFFKNESHKLMLRCAVENGVDHVFWYLDNKLIGRIQANDKLFFTPDGGEHKISCTDDKGRNTDIYIRVSFL